jgi:hypothetical protein
VGAVVLPILLAALDLSLCPPQDAKESPTNATPAQDRTPIFKISLLMQIKPQLVNVKNGRFSEPSHDTFWQSS